MRRYVVARRFQCNSLLVQALQLIAQCDILVENFKVGALTKYGLGYEALHQKYPRLIYCSITGFGQTGPYAPRPGYDSIFQAMGGLMSVTGYPDEEGGAPVKTGPSIADFIGGQFAAIGVIAALYERDAKGERSSGRGQQVDIALLDPHFSSALVTRNHSHMVFDQLYGVDDAARPRPQMAAGHVIEDDGRTWKITLREGLRFHDGQPVLARRPLISQSAVPSPHVLPLRE